MSYVEPIYQRAAFTCPHCGVLSQMHWFPYWTRKGGGWTQAHVDESSCEVCGDRMLWEQNTNPDGMRTSTDATLLWPNVALGPTPHQRT